MISREQALADIALAEKATPGPWWYDTYNTLFSGSSQNNDLKIVCEIPDHPDGESFWLEQINERSEWYAESQNNIQLIERASAALPEYARQYMEAMELLCGMDQEVAEWELEHPAMKYVTVQIDKPDWMRLKELIAAYHAREKP